MAVDVTVRGGGVFGLSAAWACARRGAKVRLVEPRVLGAGASGGVVGALAPHVPERWDDRKQAQLDSLLMAGDWWAEVAGAGGVDPGYARTGRVQPLADSAAVALAQARAAGAVAHWGAAATWEVVPVSDGPLAPAAPTGLAIRDTLSARIAPRRALAALAAALRARGGEIVEGRDAAEEGAVIHATGWEGLGALGAGGGEKGQALLLQFGAAGTPQVYAGGLHMVPHADGTLAIGSTSERQWADPGPDAQAEALLARAVAACPALAGAPVLERWAGIRPRAATRTLVLGPWPGRHGHFVMNGGYKTGFGMAPWAAERMADHVLGGRDAIPAAFRPDGDPSSSFS